MANYVDNAKFSQALKAYRDECEALDLEGKPHNKIPDYIGTCFYEIAKHYSTKHSFARYSFREDMVSEATIACCSKVLKYDADASPYAFAYYSRICFHVFIDMIHKEKTESYIKAKLFAQNPEDSFEVDDIDSSDHTGDNLGQDFIPYFDVNDYEKKLAEKKEKIKAKKIEREASLKVNVETFMTE